MKRIGFLIVYYLRATRGGWCMKKLIGFILVIVLGMTNPSFCSISYAAEDYSAKAYLLYSNSRLLSAQEKNICDLFPGFTLYKYESLNGGNIVYASYYRLENTKLRLKHVHFSNTGIITYEVTTLPVPLSENILQTLTSKPLEELFDLRDGDAPFPLEKLLDISDLPICGKVVQADVQQYALVLLVEDENGNRKVHLLDVTSDGDYYSLLTTAVLPSGTTLDLFHRTDGEIYFQWENHRYEVGYVHTAANEWLWSWSKIHSELDDFEYSAVFCGVSIYGPWTEGNRDHLRIGTMENTALSNADLSQFPQTESELLASMKRDGWAIIHAQASTHKASLYGLPTDQVEPLGEFYTGTPLQVEEQKADWTKVTVGNHELSGWIKTSDLAFGSKMDQVIPAFPEKMYLLEYEKQQPAYSSRNLEIKENLGEIFHIIGVIKNKLYVLLTESGHIRYVPQEWMWDGNG